MSEQHNIPPVFDEESRVLILGSFPSVKSREQGFFYGHPQNRFWLIVAQVMGQKTPITIEEKRAFLIKNHIALWDVVASCEITGSADSSIKNVVCNDIGMIIRQSNIRQIFVNGKTAQGLYIKYIQPLTEQEAICLPSTSPANAAWSVERLVKQWKQINNY